MTQKRGLKQRIIGTYGGKSEGPTIICLGGVHGNEPAGVNALEAVFNRLEELAPDFRGELIGICGNLKALERGVRYVDHDLNRIWEPDVIDQLLSGDSNHKPHLTEEFERIELIEAFRDFCQKQHSEVYFVDLHTTSAKGSPFITISDTLRNRDFAEHLPVPVILGIEEQLDSTLLNYLNEWGFITIGFEAGQHDDQRSVENCIAMLWIMLVRAGCLNPGAIADYKKSYTTLERASSNDSNFYEVLYRHDIQNDDNFIMNPGYKNFQEIRKGEVLASNSGAEIVSPHDGNIFMPLYQKQGNDGFFIIKHINPFWLNLSSVLRKLRVEKVLPYLPGIDRQAGSSRILIVDLEIAKWYLIELLHILGYRRKYVKDGKLITSRREFDITAPHDYRFNINFKNI